MNLLNQNKYTDSLAKLTYTKVSGTSSPRGRIYDRNYNIIVDNKSLKTVRHAIKENKDAIIVVVGCMSQNKKEEVLKIRNDLDQEIKERRGDVQAQEKRLIQKEENLDNILVKLYAV